ILPPELAGMAASSRPQGLPVLPPPDIRKEHAIETYKALTTTGVEAVKTALFLNGGAAVAFLTFLGNLLSKQLPLVQHAVPDLKPALSWYLVGVTAAGISLVFGYLLTLRLYRESLDQTPQWHPWLLWTAFGVAVGSYVCFIVG